MRKRIPFKNHHFEIQLLTQRLVIILLFMGLMIAALIARLADLQICKADIYTTLSTKNWLDLVPIEPPRGLIFDRNGILLAENLPVFSLDIIPNEVANLPETLKTLGQLVALNDNDLTQFHKQVKQHRRFDEIPLKLRLSEDEVAHVVENQFRLPGVVVKARMLRNYPLGKSFSHVIGYVGRINIQELNEIDQGNYSASHYIGKSGIEKYYEDELHGTVGYEQVEIDASGKPVRTLKEIKGLPGTNIYLTIDSKLQMIAEKTLENNRGAIVAIQPATGQVLAMVSNPGFDPNIFVQGINQHDYHELQESKDKPLFNRALRGLYPMASTIKPYYALEGLRSGVINPDARMSDPGWYELPNGAHVFHDWRHEGHGMVDLSKAISESCDTYFYNLAFKLGINRMDTILTEFGFGELTGIDLEDELPGIVASPKWKRAKRNAPWYLGDTIISGIGQGYMQATPLQLASAAATLANRGKRFIPYLQLGEHVPNKPYTPQQPIALEQVNIQDEDTWETVIDAMQETIESPSGTAHRFGVNHGFSVASKTGTAQVIAKRGDPNKKDLQENVPKYLRDHHLFIAFAPVEDPKIALAIITENENTAVESARTILDFYLKGIVPQVAPENSEETQTTE